MRGNLVLTRKPGEKLILTDANHDITTIIKVVQIKGNQVQLKINAPTNVGIDRLEIYERKYGEYDGNDPTLC